MVREVRVTLSVHNGGVRVALKVLRTIVDHLLDNIDDLHAHTRRDATHAILRTLLHVRWQASIASLSRSFTAWRHADVAPPDGPIPRAPTPIRLPPSPCACIVRPAPVHVARDEPAEAAPHDATFEYLVQELRTLKHTKVHQRRMLCVRNKQIAQHAETMHRLESRLVGLSTLWNESLQEMRLLLRRHASTLDDATYRV